MPGGDGTGPRGLGPMTGRAAGYCAGYTLPGYANPAAPAGPEAQAPGWRYAGRGRGRGWRNRYYATGMPGWQRARSGYPEYSSVPAGYGPEMTSEEERSALKQQAELIEKQLKGIRDRIKALGQNEKK